MAQATPLPDRGTCVHYRHSYRWLRFPCCDALFPCDECHDAAADHAHAWAKRMVCGHCAREQPFSNDSCVSCGGELRRGGGGSGLQRFWQGGAGERSKVLLSKRDTRKHGGSSLKTASKKAERVGDKRARLLAKAVPKTFERYRHGEVETVVVKARP